MGALSITTIEIAERALSAGINPLTALQRIERYGWPVARAVTELPRSSPPPTTPSEARDLDLRADLLAGESSAATLAARHGKSTRTIVRARARLRAQGLTVRVPNPEEW